MNDFIKNNNGKIKDIANDFIERAKWSSNMYTLMNETIRMNDVTKFTDQYIELLIRINEYHFDFQSIVRSYFGKMTDPQTINFIR